MTGRDNMAGVLESCRAGFLQFDVRLGDPGHNLARVREGLVATGAGLPGIVVLPELFAAGFDYPGLTGHAAGTGKILEELAELAGRFGVILAGSLPEEDGGRIYNTLWMIGAEGLLGKVRKQQLFSPMAEDDFFTPGRQPAPVVTSLGLIGALVCYDLRFPELARLQAGAGAQLLVVSAQWPAARRGHWRTLLQARAIENQVFVVGCNRCGTTGQTEFGGHSMVIAPDGSILHEAGGGAETAMVAIDSRLVERSRRLFTAAAQAPYRYADRKKIVDPAEVKALAERYRILGRRLVFTNGCFDILHQGHVSCLEEARRLGDCLVVGVNSDSSVRTLNKGPERPVNGELARARVLAALGCVDHVVIFSEDTPHELIRTILPDVLVKGGDWPVEQIVGAGEVLAAGGEVLAIPLVGGFSTTALINRLKGPRAGG